MCDYCSWIDQILARISTEEKPQKKKRRVYVDPVIIVHGGAGKIPQKMRNRMLLDVKNAAIESYSDLINGGKSIDAAENAICYMEGKPYFNCGKGGSLDVNDEVVMDAAIMTRQNAGAVGAVRDIEHPISLARKVLECTNHVLIVENGAQKLALDHGIPILEPGMLNICESLVSSEYESSCCTEDSELKPMNVEEIKECDSECVIKRSIEGEAYCVSSASTDLLEEPLVLEIGAVGAVAYDRKKRLTSATSTAGEPGKPIGLISATGTVAGCGIYTNTNGGVSISGDDTNIYSYAPARRILKKISEDAGTDVAVTMILQDFKNETGSSDIGAIVIDAKGEPFISFKSLHFPWAYCHKGYVYYGCVQSERYWEKVDVLERPLDCMCISSSEGEDEIP